MKPTPLSKLGVQYMAALRSHVEQPSSASLQAAHGLGGKAVALGLETLDLAKLHDHAVEKLLPPGSSTEARKEAALQAASFFTEAMLPVEKTHRVALEASVELTRLNQTLARHTVELADSNRLLRLHISDRKTTQAALKQSERATGKLLKESRLLERQLQAMTRRILSGNEEKRKKMSLQLNEEIAQPLLGIHVRLLALKKEAAANHSGLTKEITITQRLVEQSMKTIKQFVNEYGIPYEA